MALGRVPTFPIKGAEEQIPTRSNMPTLLAIEVSPRFGYSISRKLTAVFVEEWKAANPGGSVVVRDLVKTDLPFVDLAWIGGAFTPSEAHSPEMTTAIKVSDDLFAELKAADRIVIGTPMYNFMIPAALKAYIDHIVRVGVTFSADNKVFVTTGNSAGMGLLTGKSADIILASGGDYLPGSRIENHNQASGYLRQVLAWIGITDVNIVLASRAVAGVYGETAVERLGEVVRAAAVRELAAPSLANA
jgi:FMN-dependent NADH-azoreductase